MGVVQVDVIDAHLLQTALEALVEELGAVIGAESPLALGGDGRLNAKLGGEEDVGATLRVKLEPLADEGLAVAVGVGRVPVGAAELPGAV